jgi:hypothetical protein
VSSFSKFVHIIDKRAVLGKGGEEGDIVRIEFRSLTPEASRK